jgi:hypothetical protein
MQNRPTRLIIIIIIIITSILTSCSSNYPKISTPFGNLRIKEVTLEDYLYSYPREGYIWLVVWFNDGINGEEFLEATKDVELCPLGGINRFCLSSHYHGTTPGRMFLAFEEKPGDVYLTFGNYSLKWPDNDNIFIEIPLE